MCGRIALVRERKAQLHERRAELAAWARDLLDGGARAYSYGSCDARS
jgi:hypothetical protein